MSLPRRAVTRSGRNRRGESLPSHPDPVSTCTLRNRCSVCVFITARRRVPSGAAPVRKHPKATHGRAVAWSPTGTHCDGWTSRSCAGEVGERPRREPKELRPEEHVLGDPLHGRAWPSEVICFGLREGPFGKDRGLCGAQGRPWHWLHKRVQPTKLHVYGRCVSVCQLYFLKRLQQMPCLPGSMAVSGWNLSRAASQP